MSYSRQTTPGSLTPLSELSNRSYSLERLTPMASTPQVFGQSPQRPKSLPTPESYGLSTPEPKSAPPQTPMTEPTQIPVVESLPPLVSTTYTGRPTPKSAPLITHKTPLPKLPQVSQLPQLAQMPSYPGLPSLEGISSSVLPEVTPGSYTDPTYPEIPDFDISSPPSSSPVGTFNLGFAGILGDNMPATLIWNYPIPEPHPSEPNSTYQRVGCMTSNNDCFFHAVAKALAPIYQNSYSTPDTVSEATLRNFEASLGVASLNELFPPTIFSPMRGTAENYNITDKFQYGQSMYRFRVQYARKLRYELANTIMSNSNIQNQVRTRMNEAIQMKVDEYVSSLNTSPDQLQQLVNEIVVPIIAESGRWQDLDALFQQRLNEYHQIRTMTRRQMTEFAFQKLLEEMSTELRSEQPVGPYFMFLMSNMLDIDMYLIRYRDLINGNSNSSLLFGGRDIHEAVRGPPDMREMTSPYYGMPARNAIVIINVDDIHYEIIARITEVSTASGQTRENAEPIMGSNEPLIRTLFGTLRDRS